MNCELSPDPGLDMKHQNPPTQSPSIIPKGLPLWWRLAQWPMIDSYPLPRGSYCFLFHRSYLKSFPKLEIAVNWPILQIRTQRYLKPFVTVPMVTRSIGRRLCFLNVGFTLGKGYMAEFCQFPKAVHTLLIHTSEPMDGSRSFCILEISMLGKQFP